MPAFIASIFMSSTQSQQQKWTFLCLSLGYLSCLKMQIFFFISFIFTNTHTTNSMPSKSIHLLTLWIFYHHHHRFSGAGEKLFFSVIWKKNTKHWKKWLTIFLHIQRIFVSYMKMVFFSFFLYFVSGTTRQYERYSESLFARLQNWFLFIKKIFHMKRKTRANQVVVVLLIRIIPNRIDGWMNLICCFWKKKFFGWN